MILVRGKKLERAFIVKDGKHTPVSIYMQKSFRKKLDVLFEDQYHRSFIQQITDTLSNQSVFLNSCCNLPLESFKKQPHSDNTYRFKVNNENADLYVNESEWYTDNDVVSLQVDQGYMDKSNVRIGTYYSEWSIYDRKYPLRKFPIFDVNHIFYSFVGISGQISKDGDTSGKKAFFNACGGKNKFSPIFIDNYASLQAKENSTDVFSQKLAGNIAELYRAKKVNPNLKVICSIGGWTLSDPFFEVCSTKGYVEKFCDNLYWFLKEFDVFDGVDFDYEFQGGRGLNQSLGSYTDGDTYLYFIRKVKKTLIKAGQDNAKSYTLNTTIGINDHILEIMPIKEICEVSDGVNLMTYDMYGGWSKDVGYQSRLWWRDDTPEFARMEPHYVIDNIIDRIVNMGADKSKLNIGVCAYARGWQNFESNSTTDNPFEGTTNSGSDEIEGVSMWDKTSYQFEQGVIDFTGIIEMYGPNGTIEPNAIKYDDKSGAAFVWDKTNKIFLTFDDERCVRAKAKYVKDRGLQGLFYWEAQTDKDNILIQNINDELGNKKLTNEEYMKWRV